MQRDPGAVGSRLEVFNPQHLTLLIPLGKQSRLRIAIEPRRGGGLMGEGAADDGHTG